MAQNEAFSLPAHLRRCLIDRLTGTLSLLGPDGRVSVTVGVDDGSVRSLDGSALPTSANETGPDRVRASLEPLFALSDMPSIFERGLTSVTSTAGVSLADVLLDGIRSTKDSSRVSGWLGERFDVLELVPNPYSRFSEASLGPTEGYMLSRIDRPMSVQTILDDAAIDSDLALRIVCVMRYAGVLNAVDPAKPWIGDRPAFEVADTSHESSETSSGTGSDELAQAFYLVEEKLRSVQAGADLYAILEVERRATTDRIKASYRDLAKTFHPDRHAQLAAFDADIKSRLEVIFTALTNAYSTLSNTKDREAYDSKLHKSDQASAHKAPVATPVIPTPKPPPVQPPAPPPPTPEPKVVKGPVKPPMPIPVVAPLPRAPKKPPRPANSTDTVTKPAAAHTTASSEPAGELTPPPPAGPKVPAPKPTVQPDALYDHGRAYAESGDWERAVQALKRGIQAAPEDARMHAKLGAALASLHGLNKLAEASLKKSLELDSNSAERFVEVAEVYLQFDRPEDAKTLFKRAFLIDSDNVEARAALGKLGIPSVSTDAQPGFFKRLFRKS